MMLDTGLVPMWISAEMPMQKRDRLSKVILEKRLLPEHVSTGTLDWLQFLFTPALSTEKMISHMDDTMIIQIAMRSS